MKFDFSVNRKWHKFAITLFLMVCFCFTLWLGTVYAQSVEQEKRMVRAGIDIFPSVLSADEDIALRRGPGGVLVILIVYTDEMGKAKELAAELSSLGNIKSIPIRVDVVETGALVTYKNDTIAGVFLGQPVKDGIKGIIKFGIEHHVIVFSPFAGDVKRGIMSGIVVKEQILPEINVTIMKASGIKLKPFFLGVAEKYE